MQRFGKVKVEATSFTISEPTSSLEVSAMLYDFAASEQRAILSEHYGVKPFALQTITLERIFVDKLFAAEAYTRKSSDPHRAFEAAKHIYDLAVMRNNDKVKALLDDADQMKLLLEIRLAEEQGRLDGIPGVTPSEFVFFGEVPGNACVRNAYDAMQRQYVLRSEDEITYGDALAALDEIRAKLSMNPSWTCA